jgi:hypothetical protein
LILADGQPEALKPLAHGQWLTSPLSVVAGQGRQG